MRFKDSINVEVADYYYSGKFTLRFSRWNKSKKRNEQVEVPLEDFFLRHIVAELRKVVETRQKALTEMLNALEGR